MMYEFTARAVTAEDGIERDVTLAGVAENEDGSGRFLMFTRILREPSQRDAPLEFDVHCVMVTPDQATVYGIACDITLRRNLLMLSLDAASLDGGDLEEGKIQVVLDVPTEDVNRLEEILVWQKVS
jgi:hypothetical protein